MDETVKSRIDLIGDYYEDESIESRINRIAGAIEGTNAESNCIRTLMDADFSAVVSDIRDGWSVEDVLNFARWFYTKGYHTA